MSVLSEIEARRIKDATIRAVILRITNRTHDLATVGARAFVWKHALTVADKKPKLLTLAAHLGVSSARASTAVSAAESALFEVRNVKRVFQDDTTQVIL
jgi:hypothetical protein